MNIINIISPNKDINLDWDEPVPPSSDGVSKVINNVRRCVAARSSLKLWRAMTFFKA